MPSNVTPQLRTDRGEPGYCIIACGCEIVAAFVWGEELEYSPDFCPEALVGPFGAFLNRALNFENAFSIGLKSGCTAGGILASHQPFDQK